MKIVEIKSGIFLVDAPGPSSNVVYFKTTDGVVLMDTTSTTAEMQAVLDLAGLSPENIVLVINTHADGDHIGGNSLFSCPILAHEITYERMAAASRAANEMPTETFSGGNMSLSIGGLEIELIYKGGHKPDLTMLWLPQQKVLLPSDLIFENCYPYMIGSDVPIWIDALRSLSTFEADVIFPGHGTLCDQEAIDALVNYMKTSWEITAAHIEKGDSLEIILKDPALPRPKGWERETRFETNIETIYDQILAKQVP
jgi:cyclase